MINHVGYNRINVYKYNTMVGSESEPISCVPSWEFQELYGKHDLRGIVRKFITIFRSA